MRETRKNVQRNLVHYLSLNKINQKELAEQLNVSQAAVTNWIKGKNSPDIETVTEICAILNISLHALFGIADKNEYTETERKMIV